MSKQFPTFYVGPVARDAALLVLLDCWLEIPCEIDVSGLALLKYYCGPLQKQKNTSN